ncbi:MAG: sigma-70 family RNA polymerase sigma factor [Planctomycetota bacterium]|nr:MAG: sigma-70 family RNA polymerase sigma factor [Planctomycetota bacterium]
MVSAMANIEKTTVTDDLVLRARTDADALGRLYELYYERIFRFCVHRLFSKEVAEDVTAAVFLAVAAKMHNFTGRTEQDFRNWLYAIAANNANAYIRKASRRNELLQQATASRTEAADCTDDASQPDWPTLYTAISSLKPKHQTILTLRFFENLQIQEIAKIINAKESTVRVTLHRILRTLKNNLQSILDGENRDV